MLNYSPFEGHQSFCSKAAQVNGTYTCSDAASYARSPEDLANTMKIKNAQSGPQTYYLTYDDIAQNREQPCDNWQMEIPTYWKKNPDLNVNRDFFMGISSTREAKDAHRLKLKKVKNAL